MNLTPLQARKRSQFLDDIAHLEKQVAKHGPWSAIRTAWALTLLLYIGNYFFEGLADHKPLPDFVKDYGWKRIIFNFFWWALLTYISTVKSFRSELKTRRKEFAAYEAKLAKEAVS
jgi:hypothetical protein